MFNYALQKMTGRDRGDKVKIPTTKGASLLAAESRIPSHVVWTEPELITALCQWAAAAHEMIREAYESAEEAEQRMQQMENTIDELKQRMLS